MAFPQVIVECMFTSPTWTDISAWVRRVNIKRGSSRMDGPVLRYDAGTATLWLDNRDRRFDPENLAGPYVAGFSADTGIHNFVCTRTQFYGHGFTVAVKSAAGQIAQVADARTTASGTTSSFTVARPTGTASGRVMLAFHSSDLGTTGGMSVTGGTTWQPLTSRTSGDDTLQSRVWWKVAGGSEPVNYTFGQGSGADGVATVVTLNGADGAATPVFASLDNPESQLFATSGVTPAGSNDLELRWVAGTGGASGSTWASPDGYTERADAQSGSFVAASLASKELTGLVGAGTATRVLPMRPIRIRAVWASVTYDLFRGFVDFWDVDWEGQTDSEVTVPCSDAFAVFGENSRSAVTPVGAGELSGARINRILDSLGWPGPDRVIAAGDTTMQATTLEGDGLSELQLVADSELGELYVRGDGKVVFRNRRAIITESRSTAVQATFGGGPGELPYHKVGYVTDNTQLFNTIRITREGGGEQVAQDAASVSDFLTRTFERSGLVMESDADALAYAGWVLNISAQPETRFATLWVRPAKQESALFPQALSREIGDRIEIARQPPGGGAEIRRQVFIRGIEHEITGGWGWDTTWVLQSATRYGSFFTLSHPVLGVIGANALVY